MKARWSKAARRDMRRITAFYRAINPQLSAEMRRRIETGILHLCDYPMFGSPAPDRNRTKWRIPKTDFLIFFSITGDVILIDEVVHGREDWMVYNRL